MNLRRTLAACSAGLKPVIILQDKDLPTDVDYVIDLSQKLVLIALMFYGQGKHETKRSTTWTSTGINSIEEGQRTF